MFVLNDFKLYRNIYLKMNLTCTKNIYKTLLVK